MATASTTPAVLHLEVTQGKTFRKTLDFSIDLTGYELKASVVSANTGETVAEFEVDEVDMEDGVIAIELTAEDTADIAVGVYLWSMSWTEPGSGGSVAPVFKGTFEVQA